MSQTPTSSPHRHDPEIIECRECPRKFDLARQNYYYNICPTCREREA